QSALGDAHDHRVRGVEELRLQHDHPAGRAAGDPAGVVRGGAHRRCLGAAAVLAHHPADVEADHAAGDGVDRGRLFPAVRRAVRDDRGRPAAEHRQRALPDVRRRFQMVEHGGGFGGRVPAVRHHPDDHDCAAAAGAARGAGMNPRLARWLVNGALFGGAAIAMLPLLWMLSVSFMAPGAASSLPPPLLPAHPTLGNYRELFAHAGMGRYVLNSLFISGAVALFALLCNLMAGYAFAKLRFAGRERLFQALIGALVVPAQVAMLPLFLLLKYAGLVNSYAGVIVPGMATIFGIYLVREYARGVP